MANDEPRGAVHWIDHRVVGTNDLVKWVDWAVKATGAKPWPMIGITTAARKRNAPINCFLDFANGPRHMGAFLQPEVYPESKGLGKELPRCAFFIRPEDMDSHLKRLDQHSIPHSDPVPMSTDGDNGTAIYFEDPDGNQYEFWAPVHMPDGAMEVCTSQKVGRISHMVFGSRNLERTAAYFKQYCSIGQMDSPEIPDDTLVLNLLGGARLVYKLVDSVDVRVVGHGPWYDMHTALTIRAEEYLNNYQRMWDGLPEEKDAKENLNQTVEEHDALPARTGLHRNPWGPLWKKTFKRGDEFYDWDGHGFHFVGGIPLKDDGSMTFYRGKESGDYLKERGVVTGGPPRP